jgi:hypothetical protein
VNSQPVSAIESTQATLKYEPETNGIHTSITLTRTAGSDMEDYDDLDGNH